MTRSYRQSLIDIGAITPANQVDHGARYGLIVLRLDERGRARALKNIEDGGRGAKMMEMPFGLGLWHEKALELREKRERAAARKLN